MAKKAKSETDSTSSAGSYVPGSIDWADLINHAHHVRNILFANNKPTFCYHVIDPPLEAAERGERTATVKKNLRQAITKGIEDYSDLFFNDKSLFLT